MSLLSSPVSSAYLRCWDKIGATLTASNTEAKSSEVGSLGWLAACVIVCKICRGSPWLTTKIANLQNVEHNKISWQWIKNILKQIRKYQCWTKLFTDIHFKVSFLSAWSKNRLVSKACARKDMNSTRLWNDIWERNKYPSNSDSIVAITFASLEATSLTLSPPSGPTSGFFSSIAQISSYCWCIERENPKLELVILAYLYKGERETIKLLPWQDPEKDRVHCESIVFRASYWLNWMDGLNENVNIQLIPLYTKCNAEKKNKSDSICN